MSNLSWQGGRTPLENEELENVRRAAYWVWSGERTEVPIAQGRLIVDAQSVPLSLHKLETADDADFEACHMRHSIGYAWDHYSKIGDIYSLREGGLPKATAMVRGGTVIHAREIANSPLSADSLTALEELKDVMGWSLDMDFGTFQADEPVEGDGGSPGL